LELEDTVIAVLSAPQAQPLYVFNSYRRAWHSFEYDDSVGMLRFRRTHDILPPAVLSWGEVVYPPEAQLAEGIPLRLHRDERGWCLGQRGEPSYVRVDPYLGRDGTSRFLRVVWSLGDSNEAELTFFPYSTGGAQRAAALAVTRYLSLGFKRRADGMVGWDKG
jgi:hypothetical protein